MVVVVAAAARAGEKRHHSDGGRTENAKQSTGGRAHGRRVYRRLAARQPRPKSFAALEVAVRLLAVTRVNQATVQRALAMLLVHEELFAALRVGERARHGRLEAARRVGIVRALAACLERGACGGPRARRAGHVHGDDGYGGERERSERCLKIAVHVANHATKIASTKRVRLSGRATGRRTVGGARTARRGSPRPRGRGQGPSGRTPRRSHGEFEPSSATPRGGARQTYARSAAPP